MTWQAHERELCEWLGISLQETCLFEKLTVMGPKAPSKSGAVFKAVTARGGLHKSRNVHGDIDVRTTRELVNLHWTSETFPFTNVTLRSL